MDSRFSTNVARSDRRAGWRRSRTPWPHTGASSSRRDPWTRPVYRKGTGPAVIVIHEMPGLHPLVIRFADRIAAAGMTVFCPSLFGEPGRPVTIPYVLGSMLKGICIQREFSVWATDRSSPIVDWLRAL